LVLLRCNLRCGSSTTTRRQLVLLGVAVAVAARPWRLSAGCRQPPALRCSYNSSCTGSLAARREKFRVHRARERHFHRLTQQLAWGFTTVKSQWRNKGPSRRTSTRANRPTLSIIGFGDASIGHGSPLSRKSGCGPSRAFKRFVHANYKSVCFLRVDEFRTSKVCTSCWECDKTNLVVAGSRLHKIQACKRHGKTLIVDRDASASVAIMAVLLGMIFEKQVGSWDDRWRDRAVSIHKKTPKPPG
jgi:hypothetical protein